MLIFRERCLFSFSPTLVQSWQAEIKLLRKVHFLNKASTAAVFCFVKTMPGSDQSNVKDLELPPASGLLIHGIGNSPRRSKATFINGKSFHLGAIFGLFQWGMFVATTGANGKAPVKHLHLKLLVFVKDAAAFFIVRSNLR